VSLTTPGANSSPEDPLLSLLRSKLTRREQTVVFTILVSPTPLTVRMIAKRTRLAYPHAKSIVRTLVAWRILTRTPVGVSFQAESSRWGPPRDPCT
jgi:hypothetical protein